MNVQAPTHSGGIFYFSEKVNLGHHFYDFKSSNLGSIEHAFSLCATVDMYFYLKIVYLRCPASWRWRV